MKITGITNYQFSSKRKIENNQYDYSLSKSFTQPADSFSKEQSNVSFTAIKTQSQFRRLIHQREVHCIYCRRVMLDEDMLNKLEQSGLYGGPVKDFVAQTKKFYRSMHTPHQQVFDMITNYAKSAPNTTLSQIISDLYPTALKKLRKSQKPVFDEIKQAASELPPEYKTKFNKFMRIQTFRLKDKPYVNEFSAKEFNYKLKNMCKTVSNDRLLTEMLRDANYLNHPAFKDSNLELPANLLNSIFGINLKHKAASKYLKPDLLEKAPDEIMLFVIDKVKKNGKKLNRPDIVELCNDASRQVNKVPVKVPFSNKTFRYDLKEALEGLEDKDLFNRIMRLTDNLPISITNPYSFITKHANASSEKIGHNLFRPSVVTIEHMNPTKKGGQNVIGNFALSCEGDNNFRQHYDMNIILNKYNIDNPQKYFNELFNDVKTGRFEKEDVQKQVKTFEDQSGRKINTDELDKL